MRLSSIGLLVLTSVSLGGCAYNGLGMGVGYGNGYDPYGYEDRYYDPYGYNSYGYSPYGYSRYGSPYAGWYNGYYYPGSGSYVYDRDGNRRTITVEQKRHYDSVAAAFLDKMRQAQNRRAGTTTSQTQTVGSTGTTTTSGAAAPTIRRERVTRVQRTERPRSTTTQSSSRRIVVRERARDRED